AVTTAWIALRASRLAQQAGNSAGVRVYSRQLAAGIVYPALLAFQPLLERFDFWRLFSGLYATDKTNDLVLVEVGRVNLQALLAALHELRATQDSRFQVIDFTLQRHETSIGSRADPAHLNVELPGYPVPNDCLEVALVGLN